MSNAIQMGFSQQCTSNEIVHRDLEAKVDGQCANLHHTPNSELLKRCGEFASQRGSMVVMNVSVIRCAREKQMGPMMMKKTRTKEGKYKNQALSSPSSRLFAKLDEGGCAARKGLSGRGKACWIVGNNGEGGARMG
jgi:hypothetical protein